MRLFLTFICLFTANCIWANNGKDSVFITGWPVDAFTMEPIIDSTRVELMTLDSTVIATTVPIWNERNRYDSQFSIEIHTRSGEFIVRVTHPNYLPTTKRFKMNLGRREIKHNIGNIKMRRDTRTRYLNETVVTASKIKFYFKGDTIVYNADAFNLAEGSMLDALVRQLPGAELKRDGRIFVNGKQIESLLLNGKDFFKGNNTILLDNLPAYTVKNIKVYDKQDEFNEAISNKVGHKIDDGEYVMDVVLKREYQIGWISNVEAGGGTHDRWLARLFALRFTPQSRVTLFANANNTNETRKPGENGEWQPSDISNGRVTTKTGGIDYNIGEKHYRWGLTGSLNATHSDTENEMLQSQENFFSGGNTFTRRRQSGDYQNTNVQTSHHFQFNLGPEEENVHDLQVHIYPKFNFERNKNAYEWLSAEFSQLPLQLDNWETVFLGPEADKNLTSILVNKVRNRQREQATQVNGGTDFRTKISLPQSPDFIILNAGFDIGRNKKHSFDRYELEDTRHRYFNQPSNYLKANVDMAITTPFDPEWVWIATTKISYDYSYNKRENGLYRLDWLEEMAGADLEALPSTREALFEAIDPTNSYLIKNDMHQTSLSFDGRYNKYVYRDNKKYARFRFILKGKLTYYKELWNYNGKDPRDDRRTTWMPSLEMQLLRNTPGIKHEIELRTKYRQQLPSMFLLMGRRFDSDPLNIQEGNTALHRTDMFSALLFYRSKAWLANKGRRLNASMEFHAYRNTVAFAKTYEAATGVRTYRPQNVNGNWDACAYATFFSRFGKEHFSIRASIREDFYHSVDLTGTDTPLPSRSLVCTSYLTLPVMVDYTREKFYIALNTQATWHHASSKRLNFQNINAANYSVGLNGNITLPWSMQLASDITYFGREGYSNKEMNIDNYVWNIQLSKSILKNKLTFALVGYDILGQISNITYSVNSQGVTETWYNAIPRYGMLRIIYKFNKQPKKRY